VDATTVIATGPHGFAGAGQILAQNLILLSSTGCRTYWIALETPFPLASRPTEIQTVILSPISSNAIGKGKAIVSQDALIVEALAEKMVELALCDSRDRNVIIWGTYCHPYGLVALLAKGILEARGIKTKVWITPTGSDMWEVGPQLKQVTSFILNCNFVSNVITYSDTFAHEISKVFGVTNIDVIPPSIDLARFRPITAAEQLKRKQELGLNQGCFVITSHSNMRPVKHPEDVCYIASQFASRLARRAVLFMIGPKIGLRDLQTPDNLDVIETGVVYGVERYLQISDVELNCSHHDSFNLSLAEAMACGVPCLSTDVVGIAPLIAESAGGKLFPYLAAELRAEHFYQDAVDYLVQLATDSVLRIETGQRGAAYARCYFHAERIAARYRDLIESE
jgi:glycosyltransferase involved in cell wall biosynthesis